MNIKIKITKYIILFICIQILIPIIDASAADWPQFRGLNRDGKSAETGLLKLWPENGPKLLWSLDGIGAGNSSAAIVNGVIYTTGMKEKKEYLSAITLDGKIIWQKLYGDAWKNSYPDPRTTPTIDGDRIYVMSGMGQLACFDLKTGKQNWTIHVVEKFKGEYSNWGISESILIDGNYLYCTPGGPNATIVALNKLTGETIWTSKGLSDKSNYSSSILVERGGKKIIAAMVEKSFVGIDAKTGKIVWNEKYDNILPNNKSINPNSPVYYNGSIYITAGYDWGCARFDLSADGTKIIKKWTDNTLDVHIGGVIIVDGYLYGANWLNNKDGNWVCLNWETGKVMYEESWFCKGSTIYADGMLYCYEEKKGNLALVKATPEKFDIVSSFRVPLGKSPYWAHPSISNGVLYVRNDDFLMAYSIKAK
ncbi:PQQ-binding-like beta-propeller repeat protein [candidate division KSB1 bacterium]|nr:PQQ-binding-like beta-propeller repeat protein [candidate division KSB1 bacterium]